MTAAFNFNKYFFTVAIFFFNLGTDLAEKVFIFLKNMWLGINNFFRLYFVDIWRVNYKNVQLNYTSMPI